MKRRVIITNKKGMYELHHELSSDFPAGIYPPPLKNTKTPTTETLEHGVKYAQSQQQGDQNDTHR